MSFNIWGDLIGTVGKVADDLITSDEERLKAKNELKALEIKADSELLHAAVEESKAQNLVNAAQAKNKSLFVSGARPAILWITALGLAYSFLLRPLLLWAWAILQAKGAIPLGVIPPPDLNNDLLQTLVFISLGAYGWRTLEKIKGVAREKL